MSACVAVCTTLHGGPNLTPSPRAPLVAPAPAPSPLKPHLVHVALELLVVLEHLLPLLLAAAVLLIEVVNVILSDLNKCQGPRGVGRLVLSSRQQGSDLPNLALTHYQDSLCHCPDAIVLTSVSSRFC